MDRWVGVRMADRDARAGMLTLASSAFFLGAAVVLRMDMLMCLFIVLALRVFWRMYEGRARRGDTVRFPAYVFLALFTKGPVGLLVPLVSVLADGEARVKAVGASETVHYALQGGYVEVTDDKVIMLADRALPAADIDVEQVREQLAGIEEQLSGLSEEEARKTTLAADKAWCDVQLRVAKAA